MGNDEEEDEEDDEDLKDFIVDDDEEEDEESDDEDDEEDDGEDLKDFIVDDDEEEDEESEEEQPVKKAKKVISKEEQKKKQKQLEEQKKKQKQAEEQKKKQKQLEEQKKKQKPKTMTLKAGVLATELKPGSGLQCKRGDKVTMRYIGRLKKNNKVFDQTRGRSTFDFRLGSGEVIKGWDIGVAGMKIGERRRLVLPSKVAYGAAGAQPVIPPHADLVFEVELVKVNNKTK